VDLEQVSKTVGAMEKLIEEFSKVKPETVVVISPHAPLDPNQFTVFDSSTLIGNFHPFGDLKTELIFKNDLNLVEKIKKESEETGIPLKTADIKTLDHGTLVPLFYLSKGVPDIKIVPLAFSFLDPKIHFEFGKMLQRIINNEQRTIGIVASGDLSHRLTSEAPGGFSPQGKEFDEKIVNLLRKKDVKGIINMDKDLREKAGECGYRSIVILLGALEGLDWEPEILSYEGTFGVGYMVANFKIK